MQEQELQSLPARCAEKCRSFELAIQYRSLIGAIFFESVCLCNIGLAINLAPKPSCLLQFHDSARAAEIRADLAGRTRRRQWL